jgi:hypothetical protein
MRLIKRILVIRLKVSLRVLNKVPLWVNHDRAEPTVDPATSAFSRLRPVFAAQLNFVMCQDRPLNRCGAS